MARTGKAEDVAHQRTFGPITVAWEGDVLEPRAWTLAQSQWLTELAPDAPPGPILELFAGVGHIGLAAAHLTGRPLVQVDISCEACDQARANAARNGVVGVDVRCGDVSDVLADDERFPLVLADPPYIPSDEVERFPEDPEGAIDGGHDGLDLVRLAVEVAHRHLAPGGSLVLQLRNRAQADRLDDALADGTALRLVSVRELGEDRALAHLVGS